jgi:hypothetical protein
LYETDLALFITPALPNVEHKATIAPRERVRALGGPQGLQQLVQHRAVSKQDFLVAFLGRINSTPYALR